MSAVEEEREEVASASREASEKKAGVRGEAEDEVQAEEPEIPR